MLLTGFQELGKLTQELAFLAYTTNTRQASETMVALGQVQRYLAGVQILLLLLLLLLLAAMWFSLRERLRVAYRQIATQRVVEVQLRQAKERAEEASRIKSDFLASMSHELRTPLTAMLGFGELVLRDTYGKVPKRIREALTKSHSHGEHLLHLVNDVLDLSRLEAERMPLDWEDCKPALCIEDAVQHLDVLAKDKGLRLTVEPADGLPAYRYDRRRLAQVLINLIGNAIKFTEQGEVRVGVEAHPGELRYRVSDTGIGIAADRIGTLFVEFQQLDSHIARSAPGAGLGLAISKRLVELHGGRIWVESQPGVGSTFYFSIPDGEPHGEAGEAQEA